MEPRHLATNADLRGTPLRQQAMRPLSLRPWRRLRTSRSRRPKLRILESGSPPTIGDGYIRVRVTDEPHRDGSLLVYLPDGTALVVNGHLLLHLDPGPNCPEYPSGASAERSG
jgi:hypothetical protein